MQWTKKLFRGWSCNGQKNFLEGHTMDKKTFRGSCDGQKNFLDGHAMDKNFF
jgi:hypothetical protein